MRSTPMRFTTSRPFSSGICTSRNTSSGCSFSIALIAAAPLPHSATSSMSGSHSSRRRSRRRAGGSSSTISTRILITVSWRRAEAGADGSSRKSEPDTYTAGLELQQLQDLLPPVELLQARARIGETYTARQQLLGCAVQAPIEVADFECQLFAVPKSVDHDHVAPLVGADAVTDRVLDEWLQHQARDGKIE